MPPHGLDQSASFGFRVFDGGALTSAAEGRWLIVPNEGDQLVAPGSVLVCTEGRRVVAYFHVDLLVEP